MRFVFFALGLSVLGCSADVASSDDAITNGRVLVHFGDAGQTIRHWGYDVKQDGRSKALDPALADELFDQIGLNMLRVPIRAADAHPSAGVSNIVDSAYARDLNAIANAKAASPHVALFASLKLDGDHSFPDWVKSGGEVDAPHYATLVENYLDYMASHGVTIDWLGVDNESKFNEGNITPAKYDAIVSRVKTWCNGHGVTVPGFIAPENYGPAEDTPWLDQLWGTRGRFENVDRVGVHYYSQHRDGAYAASLRALGDHAHGKYLWDSELHWNDTNGDGVHFDDLMLGMLTVMDHFDAGFHAMSWWAFQPRSSGTKAGHVMSELVTSTLGAAPLRTDDGDGSSVAGGKMSTRALKNGPNRVTLWVVNEDGTKDSKWTEIEGQKLASASFVQWSSMGPIAGTMGKATIIKENRACFSMTYPWHTITRVTVTLE
jgi:O-glycosyl hydrolase